ncbi:cytochrome-c oxidase, cbb3-type subunit III [Parahaliea sp. F7430]|uniref:Cbb3-type cytochrome c oxidase subunit n=1 Tax=Sediminihaliea albiluteola TaxID=2758564 RepID=A0A7W2TV86_9GAMM|nr:cytochrome-c oxidase, cbb3-type subunit III [Sediminihaliea albiluteola]MBA6412562.1 cytochrome-c oxidase, cbb3-type subunit III [Sediminihaliea albiluteola]
MTSFWSLWIIILTSITLIGITWILLGNRKLGAKKEDQATDHVYDGIEEYDNPLPVWWFYMFVITIVWAVGYLIVYPGMGNYPGLIGWTQIAQYEERVGAAEERHRAMYDRYLAMPIEEIADDPVVRRMGMRMFGNDCAQCHGADARGGYGFPNLTDDDWIYGGEPEQIETTITQGRQAAMPAWGSVIGDQGVEQVTAYLLELNHRNPDAELAKAGQGVFQTYCAVCHGPDAKGNIALGAPNLTNGIWLYGGSESEIAHSIRAGRNGVMPSFKDTLGPEKIHILAAYVYGLRNSAQN